MVSLRLRSCMCLRSESFPITNFACIYYFCLVRCMPSISPSLLESPKSYLVKIRIIRHLPHCLTFYGEKYVNYAKKLIRTCCRHKILLTVWWVRLYIHSFLNPSSVGLINIANPSERFRCTASLAISFILFVYFWAPSVCRVFSS
jgi:hypothetical protein